MESPDNTARQDERPKKAYLTPILTDYGTVAQVTQTGTTTPLSDGAAASS